VEGKAGVFSSKGRIARVRSDMSRCKPVLLSMFLMTTAAWASASHEVALGTASLGAGASESQNHAPYPDSAQGLKQELKDMRELVRSRRSDQLRAMITNLEFPDARAWYLANFGTPGLETADYTERNLRKSQQRLENQMVQFAHEDGYFSVKKQNAKKAFPRIITVPEIFLAAWESNAAFGQNGSETPFGYFVFVDGKFRWDSSTVWVTVD
jgi:hypothetical protein